MRCRVWRWAALSSSVPREVLRLSLLVLSMETEEDSVGVRRLILTLERSLVLLLEGRVRPGRALLAVVDVGLVRAAAEGDAKLGLDDEVWAARSELSCEVNARDPERGISFFCFLGGGCP